MKKKNCARGTLKLFLYSGNFGDLVMKNPKVFNAILNNKEEKINVSKFSQLYVPTKLSAEWPNLSPPWI